MFKYISVSSRFFLEFMWVDVFRRFITRVKFLLYISHFRFIFLKVSGFSKIMYLFVFSNVPIKAHEMVLNCVIDVKKESQYFPGIWLSYVDDLFAVFDTKKWKQTCIKNVPV